MPNVTLQYLKGLEKKHPLDRQTVISNPKTLFVYDDYEKRGRKKDPDNSLASEIRNLPNTVGIKTRRSPERNRNSDWKDHYSREIKGRTKAKKIMNPYFKTRLFQMNRDMANMIRKFVLGDYEKMFFSDDMLLRTDFSSSEGAIHKYIFNKKFKIARDYCKKFAEDRKLHDQEKLGLEVALTRDIIELLYGSSLKGIKAFRNNHPELLVESKTYLDNYLED